jgi:glycosyltransferase involved in cell wall biosynthesis
MRRYRESIRGYPMSRRLKVCIIHNIISPYRLPVFEELHKHVDVTVLFCKPITKDRAWSYDLDTYHFNYRILKGFAAGPVICNTDAYRALADSDFDVIIANNDPDVAPTAMLGFIMAKLKGKKIINWSQIIEENIQFFPSIAYSTHPAKRAVRTVLSKMIMAYRKICFAMADHFLTLSARAGQFLQEQGIAADRITVAPQVMPPELLPPPTVASKRDGRTMLYIGYLNERKGVQYLVEAFMRLDDRQARLVIAGTGPTAEALHAQAAGDTRISFVGYVEGEAKANLYATADIFVLPTLNDVWGLVINEAIHYGLAVVTSDAAVASELVDDKTGIVFTSKSVDELHAALQALTTDQSRLKAMQAHNAADTTKQNLHITGNQFLRAVRNAEEAK